MISKNLEKMWNSFLHDHLFRNSIYLMLTTGIMGLFGFIFWTIATHIFTPEEIGLGTTLISSMTMISYMSLLGFNNTFIRFLPTSENKNREINSGSIIVILTSILLGGLYIFLIPIITPDLSIIHNNFFYSIIFIFMVIVASLNSISDSLFISYRAAQYNLITNGFVISVSKLVFPVIFATIGAFGVFLSFGLSTFIGLLISMIILISKFNFTPSLSLDFKNTKKMLSYSFTSYISSLFSISPTIILPIIIINNLGSAEAGYFYLSLMIVNLLYTVSGSISQSLFAEGSYEENILLTLIKRSIFILVLILIPASIILAFFGPIILELFGKSYSNGANGLIVILAISSPIIAAFNLGGTLLKIRHQMYSLVFVNATYAIVIYTLATIWASKGLIWIAYAWILGNLVAAALSFISIYTYKHLPTISAKEYTHIK